MAIFGIFKKNTKEALLSFLQNKISDQTSLEDIVNVFKKMCSIPIKDDMILFETGTYSFTGEPMFYFSLVRQFPNSQEEYYQIHVDVMYAPSEESQNYHQATWNIDIEENLFDFVKKSREYNFCKDRIISNTKIYLDET